MKHLILIISALVMTQLFNGCGSPGKDLKNGVWRGTLKTDSLAEIPFNFEVSDSAGHKLIYIINGQEKLKVDEISLVNDSINIRLPLFDSEIKAGIEGSTLNGSWVRHLADKDVSMPFNAEHGVNWRFFKANENTKFNVGGRWSTLFISPDGKDTTVAVGEFVQDKTKITGTFLTTTGDYRFLEGSVSDDKLFLSTFDGSHAFLFTANILSDSTLAEGKFYAGASSVENWTAERDNKALLPDAYSITSLKKGLHKIEFKFDDLHGKPVSLKDDRFRNKVVIVQFLGSWCPNCMDETAYLAPFYKKYKERGVEVVGLAYERTPDVEKGRKNVGALQKRFDITYPLLLTGYTNKEVLKSIPALDSFNAFPTTIIIDKKGVVRKIHTGFSGPGTGTHYVDFTKEFEKQIDGLLAE